MSEFKFPLSPIEIQAKNHAILCASGFLILLPVGVLIARYSRTITNRWFPFHAAFQLFVAGPVILTGWYYGWKTSEQLLLGHFYDPHQKMGLTLLILYVVQLLGGASVHWIKTPSRFGSGTRPLRNYFHGFSGLVIFVVAASQVHYGLYIEWDVALGGLHRVPQSAKNAWIALVVIFWALYIVGLALLPRQFRQERKGREHRDSEAHHELRSGRTSEI
ncbi:hypothetical protein E1B28_003309 [Marasmius oreades]|uniref:Cytochrome b561 domain-containing protein n=1 Tax=Marasmius oreades TaxID=181124 RepID=A0A9P7RMT6_9AGAR|nr:uncharacterized protein E1B28_003309 [Marasmius oreades]KAG7085768.1 hypothetical protein E1B28_003309 [Marasmius oreades]